MHGDAEAYVALYDAQAVRLHAYCWSLVGDQAAATVREVFAAATYPEVMPRDAGRRPASRPAPRPTPPSDVWLYRRARAECLRRGPVTVISGRDPLLRAAARLRADQREVLVLAADFAPHDVARVLSVPPANAIHLFTAARARLEQATLNLLLADPATAAHGDIIDAFEKGTLGTLLARRAPEPPIGLRESVIDTVARKRAPLVVISPQTKPAQGNGTQKNGRPAARHAKAAAPVLGVAAACAAAVVGAMAAGATLDFDGSPAGGGQGALAPSSAEHGRQSQSGSPGGGQPSVGGESPVADVTPTTSAEPNPIETAPGEPPAPASSNSPTEEASPTPSGGRTPDGLRQAAPDPSSSATDSDTPTPTPSESESPSPSPSESPSGGLLDDLPILGDVVSGALSGGNGR